jgi:hypothetical protein
MAYRPFLSHKRQDAPALDHLKRELRFRGAGSWQDLDDLRLGQRVTAAFRRAIGRETGGFIWWGTRRSLDSRTICKLEVPAALRRQRFRRGAYPVVPLFVDLSPSDDQVRIREAFGQRRGKALCDLNGIVREKDEEISDFAARSARRYVKDLIRDHSGQPLRIAVTGGREPAADYDLVLDWREVLDSQGRLMHSDDLSRLVETLADIRTAAQSQSALPQITVEPHLRLPLAAIVGWEWNRVRPIRLSVLQTSVSGSLVVEDLEVGTSGLPEAEELAGEGLGPFVVALSVGKTLEQALPRYMNEVDSRGGIHLHLNGPLQAADICKAAHWVVHRLASLCGAGIPKHLLLLGPASLAVRIGASANGTGKTVIPFWDGDSGYGPAIVIGS